MKKLLKNYYEEYCQCSGKTDLKRYTLELQVSSVVLKVIF